MCPVNKDLYTNWLTSKQNTNTYPNQENTEPLSHDEMLQKVTNLSLDSGTIPGELDNQSTTGLANEMTLKNDTVNDQAVETSQNVMSYPDTGSAEMTSGFHDSNAREENTQNESICDPGSQEPEPQYPLDFTELMGMIQRGEQIPGVEDLNIEPTNSLPTLSQANSVRKPWET